MKKYYKVNIRTEHENMKSDEYNYEIIVEKGFRFAKEIVYERTIIACDSKEQGYNYDYYILESDLNDNNVARYDEVENYRINFSYDRCPIYDRTEKSRKLLLQKDYNRSRLNIQK